MSTSGSVNFSVNTNDIIEKTFQLLALLPAGESVSGEDYAVAASFLNMMVKHWNAKGPYLWAIQEAVLIPSDNTAEYSLGNLSTDAYATTKDDFVVTEVGTAVDTTDTAIIVDSTTGMAAADNVGIVLDNDTIHWSTIASVDSTTQITIDDAVSADGSAVGNNVYAFTSRINRPLRIESIRHVTGTLSDPSEIEMLQYSKQEYFALTSKNTNGRPNTFYYDPQLTSGKLYVWPRPDDPNEYFRFTYARSLEDFDAATDNPDFPQEWFLVLVYNLAALIGPMFGRASDDNYRVIVALAEQYLNDAMEWDQDTADIIIRVRND